MPVFLRGPIYIDEHRTQKRWLRPRQIVSTIGVEHRAIVLDLKEEVVDHPARQLNASGAQQPANNEVAVPAVRFVKAPARDNIFVRKIKQSLWLNLGSINLAQPLDHDRKMLD